MHPILRRTAFLVALAGFTLACGSDDPLPPEPTDTATDGGSDFAEPDSDASPDAEPDAVADVETDPDPDSEPDADRDADPDADPDIDVATDPDAAEDPDVAEDAEEDPDAEIDADADLDTDSGTDAEADADAGVSRGECSSEDDCGGVPCLRIHEETGGYTTCFSSPAPLDECLGDEEEESCCSAADCPAETECFAGPLFYCGGPAPIRANSCHPAQCSDDSDCVDREGGLCLPAGAFGEPAARCVYAACRVDSDCSASDGGQCSPFRDACSRRFSTFSCTYDDSPCRANTDCGGIDVCVPVSDHGTACVPFMPPP